MRSRFIDHLRVVISFRVRLCLRALVNCRALNLILVHTLLNLVRWSLILARFRCGFIRCCLILFKKASMRPASYFAVSGQTKRYKINPLPLD